MRSLHELPRFRDRWSYLYLEEGRVEVDAEGLKFWQETGVATIPIDQLAVLMLGPGTVVTHKAVQALAENNCLIAWTGQQGIRLYAASTGGTFSARRVIRQAELVSDIEKRARVASNMYRFRFHESPPQNISMEQLRGYEGARVRKAYAKASQEFGVSWKGRHYNQGDWNAADPINRAISAANACLYGLCHAAILSAGYSPALGFIHTGKMLSFVYDVADLYKTELTIPIAFRAAVDSSSQIERVTRYACRDAFHQFKVMERILPDIAEVLNAGDDAKEYPEELEGGIVTLADRNTSWSFSG